MAQPTPYNKSRTFSDLSAGREYYTNASYFDVEFALVEASVDEICENLALIQRDDGRLANASVHADALSAEVQAMIGDWTPRGDWSAATIYAVKDMATYDGALYVAVSTHVSGTFAADLSAGKWQLLTGNSAVTTLSGGTTGLTPVSATAGVVELGGTLAVAHGGTGAATAQAASENLDTALTVEDLAALKALTSRPESVVVKTGQAAGVWQWVLGSSTTADDALVVTPTTGASGRYKRIYNEGEVYATWFGADPAAPGVSPTTKADSMTALAAAAAAVPGGIVHLSAGAYYIDSATTLTATVTFRGVGWNERNNTPAANRAGTWLYRDDTSITPFTFSTTVAAGTIGFEDMGFEETQPVAAGGWAPTVYPNWVKLSGTGGLARFKNLNLYGIYGFCEAPGDVGTHGRISFQGINGQPFAWLFKGSCILDEIEFRDVHLWPLWDDDTNVLAWQQANGIPLQTGRCDGIDAVGYLALGYKSPFKFYTDSVNSPNGPTTNAKFVNLYADACKYGGWLIDSNHSVFITNSTFEGSAVAASYGFLDESTGSFVSANGFNMLGCQQDAYAQTSTANGSTAHFSNVFIQLYNEANDGSTAFYQGNTSGTPHVMRFAESPSIGVVTYAANLVNTNTDVFTVAGQQAVSGSITSPLGTAAVVNTGTSGATIPLLNAAANTWSGDMKFTDASYDIGKSGATRPRDYYGSRVVSAGTQFNIGSVKVIDVSGNYSQFYAGNGTSKTLTMESGNTYHDNTVQHFRSADTNTTFASISSTGITQAVDRGLLFTNQTSAAGAGAGTISNAPAAGNPTHWLKIKIGGSDFALPAWPG